MNSSAMGDGIDDVLNILFFLFYNFFFKYGFNFFAIWRQTFIILYYINNMLTPLTNHFSLFYCRCAGLPPHVSPAGILDPEGIVVLGSMVAPF